MDSDERDEAIVSARIEGTSTRALAKLHGCTGREVEEAIDRRLNYELDGRQRLRQVKLSVARIEGLISPFYEKAVRDRDTAAGMLVCKLEERLALLLGLDHPTTQRVDVYAVEREQEPSSHEQIKRAILAVARPNYRPKVDGNGAALAPPITPADDENRSGLEQSSMPTKDAS